MRTCNRQIIAVLALALLAGSTLWAQEITLTKDGSSLPVHQVRENVWLVDIDDSDFYLLPRDVVDRLTETIDSLSAVVDHRDTVIAIKDTLLQRYSSFERKASAHIETQQQLIQTADSLYIGYKSLYRDLKRAVGLSTFSLTAGVGWVDPPATRSRPTASVGFGYQNWVALYQVGKNLHGLSVLYRLPLGF